MTDDTVRDDTETEVALVLRAASFGADRHRKQKRKGVGGLPYINHPLAVASVLAGIGGVTDVTLLVAALLHDTVEDTETSPEELEMEFGSEVRRLVAEVSDDKGLEKTERKRLQIVHAASASDAAKQLKLADKICNVRDVTLDPPADWSLERRREYLDWAVAVIDGCRGVNAALDRHFDKLVAAGRASLAKEG
jgi:guanosine-3',5'-bis(diphosphate) 3'-pyrophosphohydrolase